MGELQTVLEFFVDEYARLAMALICIGFGMYAERVGSADLRIGKKMVWRSKDHDPRIFTALFVRLPQLIGAFYLVYWLDYA